MLWTARSGRSKSIPSADAPGRKGEVSERSKEPVLKTGVGLVLTVGSNPTLSATFRGIP